MAATWKKIIVSGSTANLANIQVDGLTSGQVVIGGGTASNLSTTAINGTGNIVATTGASGLVHSGSFSGSFQGTFTGLITSASQAATASYVTGSNVYGPNGSNSILSASYAASSSQATTASFALTASKTQNTLTFGEGLSTGTFNGSSNVTVQVSGAADLTNNAITKWNNTDNKFANSSLTDTGTVISGVSSIQLSGAASSLTGSFSGSFKGDGSLLSGVTATAIFPTTERTDITSGNKFFISQSTGQEYITYGNLLIDMAGTNLTSSTNDSIDLKDQISLTGVTASFQGNLTGTSSFATLAQTANTASYVNGNIFTSTNPATSASYALSSSFASTSPAGNLTGATLASNVLTSSLTSVGTLSSLTATNAVITNNLTVQGTASFQHTTNLEVADRFVLFASGSNTTGDGGIVVQQATQSVGELYAYDSTTNRWGFTSSFNASNASYSPAAYITTTETGAPVPSAAPIYGGSGNGAGNMYVTNGGDIYIYA